MDGFLERDGLRLCAATSESAHKYFARDSDGHGLERGKLTAAIIAAVSKRDKGHGERWAKLWADPMACRYRRGGAAGGLRVFFPQGGDLPRVGQGVKLGQLRGLVLNDHILLVNDGAQGRDHFHLVHRRRAPFAPTPISAAICRRASTGVMPSAAR